jgi:hypothetical protein
MNYNYLPKKKNENSEFVNNKETFNNRLFERNILNTEILSQKNIAPTYMSENYNINRKEADSIFNKRIIPEITNKPLVDFVNFQDSHINKVNITNKKEITSFNQIERETSFRNSSTQDNEIGFKNNLINNLNKNPFVTNNNNVNNIPNNIDFSKSNLAFFIKHDK